MGRSGHCAAMERLARPTHEPAERLDDPRPEVFVAYLGDCRAGIVARLTIAKKVRKRLDPALHVAHPDTAAQASRRDHVAERVAGRRDHGQAGPEAVEQPRSEGEATLEIIEVRGDADVRLEQVGAALLVWHPAVVEEDGAVA